MSNYVVTNIRLDEKDYLKLKEEAAKKRTSLSAIIREKVGQKKTSERYARRLLSVKGGWFSIEEFKKNRTEIEQRIQRHS